MAIKKGESIKETKEKGYSEELPEPFVKALDEIAEMKMATAPLIKEYKVLGKPLPQILDEMDVNIRAAAEASRKAEEAARAAKQAAGDAHRASTKAEKRAEKARRAGVIASEIATKAAAEAARKAEETARSAKVAAKEAAEKAEEADKGTRAAVGAFRKAAEESALSVVKEVTEAKRIAQNLRKHEASILRRIKSLEERFSNIEASLPGEKVILLREISKKEAEKEIRELFSDGQILYYSDIAEKLRLDLQLVVEICDKLQKHGEIEVTGETLQSR